VLLSALATVTWKNTRAVVISSVTFSTAQMDFGAGNENTAVCPGCNRRLPSACMHLDHILSQNRHTVSIAQSDDLHLYSSVVPNVLSDTFVGQFNGGVGRIFRLIPEVETGRPRRASRGGTYEMVTSIHTADLWKNDLENIQLICGSCNSTKGDRDFDQVFPNALTNPLAGYLT